MKKTEEYFLINKTRNRVKRLRKFEDINYEQNDFIEIVYGCVYDSSGIPVYKVSKIELIEDTRKEGKLLEERLKKANILR